MIPQLLKALVHEKSKLHVYVLYSVRRRSHMLLQTELKKLCDANPFIHVRVIVTSEEASAGLDSLARCICILLYP